MFSIRYSYLHSYFTWVCDLPEKTLGLVPDWFSFTTFVLNYLTVANGILSDYIINVMICKEIKGITEHNWA